MATGVFGKKDSADNSTKNETIEEKTTNEVETNASEDTNKSEDVSNNNSSASIKVYSSEDGKYYLILTEYPHKALNPKVSNDIVHSFSFSIDEYYSSSAFYGDYTIENGKIKLLITQSCTAASGNGEFNCTLPNGVNVTSRNDGYNEIDLEYTEDVIMLGNIKLLLKK